MKLSGVLKTAIACLTLLSACAADGYYTTVPARASYQRPTRWQDPQYFSERVRSRVGQIESQVRADVSAGRLQTQAIDELIARKNQLENVLRDISQDGYIAPSERDYVRGLVRDMW